MSTPQFRLNVSEDLIRRLTAKSNESKKAENEGKSTPSRIRNRNRKIQSTGARNVPHHEIAHTDNTRKRVIRRRVSLLTDTELHLSEASTSEGSINRNSELQTNVDVTAVSPTTRRSAKRWRVNTADVSNWTSHNHPLSRAVSQDIPNSSLEPVQIQNFQESANQKNHIDIHKGTIDKSRPNFHASGDELIVSLEHEKDHHANPTFSPPSPSTSIVSCDRDSEPSLYFVPQAQNILPTKAVLKDVDLNLERTPLNGRNIHLHLKALQIENMLVPLKPLLSRLMSHQLYNRKGIFNHPVDPARCGSHDYFSIVKDPIDLGTIRQRLHAHLYTDRDAFARDVRRVFYNAMLYNPPSHPIHTAAHSLLQIFEDSFHSILPHDTKKVHASADKRNHHSCHICKGRICSLCRLGCIPLEPSLVICSGAACAGSKVRRGVFYYCSLDGRKIWCQQCFTNLPPILPSGDSDTWDTACPLYKRHLLKRKNDEDVVENWIACSHCHEAMHTICAFSNDMKHKDDSFICQLCISNCGSYPTSSMSPDKSSSLQSKQYPMLYSFITGEELPKKLECIHAGSHMDARMLPHCAISAFIESKVQSCMRAQKCPLNAEKTITVRNISDRQKCFLVPDVIKRHFRMASKQGNNVFNESLPSEVTYQSKAVALFQRMDGIDVCLFCLYVQEYDNVDEKGITDSRQNKRVYIAYLDSVDHFRPRQCRTDVYQMFLVAYLATARARGFEYSHIWSCPPTRGNSFVFWSHPSSQKTPTRDRLLSWYHGALSKALDFGVITDVMSLYEFSFEKYDKTAKKSNVIKDYTDALMVCPPLLDGDIWIQEALRIHSNMKTKISQRLIPRKCGNWDHTATTTIHNDLTPPYQIAHMIFNNLMVQTFSVPFHRPVNAEVLKLPDYHEKIKKPMDLGTVHGRCLLGDYDTLRDLVSDVKLIVENAKLYNPKGHAVHSMADELWQHFENQLSCLSRTWDRSCIISRPSCDSTFASYEQYFCMSLRLRSVNLEISRENGSQELAISKQDSKDLYESVLNDRFGRFDHISFQLEEHNLRKYQNVPVSPKFFNQPLLAEDGYLPNQSNKCTHISDVEHDYVTGNNSKSEVVEELVPMSFQTPSAVARRMVGEDVWLLKKHGNTSIPIKLKKNSQKLPPSKSIVVDTVLKSNTLHATWLSDELIRAVRMMRTDFFVCRLVPSLNPSESDLRKEAMFQEFVEEFSQPNGHYVRAVLSKSRSSSGVADSRYGLLEFLQYRNFQFDTLRRAKYSTMMLLFYLHNPTAFGIVPTCTSCHECIRNIRWHRIGRIHGEHEHSYSAVTPNHVPASALTKKIGRKRGPGKTVSKDGLVMTTREELCSSCYNSSVSDPMSFIPVQVSFN